MSTFTRYTTQLVRYLRSTRAVSAIEYAILVGVIVAAVAGVITTMGGTVSDIMNVASSQLTNAKTKITPSNP